MVGLRDTRRWFVPAVGALLVGAGALSLACSGSECPPELQRCGSDGKLYCNAVPSKLSELPRECCPAAPAHSIDDAGAPSDAGEQPDAGAIDADAGEQQPSADADAGEQPSVDAGAASDAGEQCDAEVPDPPDGGWPTGTDDAGIPFLYQCGQDMCHPLSPGAGADAGAEDPFQCGASGCN